MNWDIDVSILKNSTILKQLFYCLVVPFILLVSIILFSIKTWEDRLELLIVFGWILLGLTVTTVLIVLIFFGGKNKLSFSMDANGVVSETRQEQAKKGKIIGILAIIVGLFARKSGVVGTGMLVGARDAVESIRWKDVQDIKYKPTDRRRCFDVKRFLKGCFRILLILVAFWALCLALVLGFTFMVYHKY